MNHTYTKFLPSEKHHGFARDVVLLSGKIIAFAISLSDLSTLEFSVNFDEISDSLVQKYNNSDKNIAIIFHKDQPIEVDTDNLSWFKF